MLSHISWQDYFMFLGLSILAYYFFIGIIFFRSELARLLNPKTKQPFPQTGSTNKKKNIVSSGTNEPSKNTESEKTTERIYVETEEPDETIVLDLVSELATELTQEAGEIGQNPDKEVLIQKLSAVVSSYGHEDMIYPFRETLRLHIQQQVASLNNLHLAPEDVLKIFPEKSSPGWSPTAAMLAFMLLSSVVTFAQDGNAGISEATSKVKSYFTTGTNLMYAIGAVVGLVGAVKVFNKWNSGEPDTAKTASAWFGSCIFLVVVATVLKSFFNV